MSLRPRRRPSATAALAVALVPALLAGCTLMGRDRAAAPPAGDALARSVQPDYRKDDTWAYSLGGEEVIEKVIDVTPEGRVLWAATDGRRWEAFPDPLLPPARSIPEAGPQITRLFTPPTLDDLTLFPLRAGRAVEYRTDLASADDGRIERAVEHTCEVRGPRQVTVPAGAFTAVEVFCQRGGRFETLYYAPEVRNTVMELRDVDGRMEKKELMAYRPAPGGEAAPTVPDPDQVTTATAEPLAGTPTPSATSAVVSESLDTPAPGAAAAASAASAPASPAPAPDRVSLAPAPAGGWTLQLAALSTEAAARQAWSRWQGKVGSIMPGAEARIEQGGGLWRLTTGRFADSTTANATCARLQKAGVQCFAKEG